MVHQMVPAPEFAVTFGADKRFFSLVYQYVRLQLVGVAETTFTNLTFVRPFARVNA